MAQRVHGLPFSAWCATNLWCPALCSWTWLAACHSMPVGLTPLTAAAAVASCILGVQPACKRSCIPSLSKAMQELRRSLQSAGIVISGELNQEQLIMCPMCEEEYIIPDPAAAPPRCDACVYDKAGVCKACRAKVHLVAPPHHIPASAAKAADSPCWLTAHAIARLLGSQPPCSSH